MIDDMPTPPPIHATPLADAVAYARGEYARRFGFWYGLAAGYVEQRLAHRWPAWRLHAPPPATYEQMEKALRRAGWLSDASLHAAEDDLFALVDRLSRVTKRFTWKAVVENGLGLEPDAVVYDGSVYRRGSDGRVTEERLLDHDG